MAAMKMHLRKEGAPKTRKPHKRLVPPGAPWIIVKAVATMAIVFMLGGPYLVALKTGQVHNTWPVIKGTLIMCGGAAALMVLIGHADSDFQAFHAGKRPWKGIMLVLLVIGVVGFVGYHVVKAQPVTTWNEQTGQAGTAAGLAIAVLVLFVWSLFRTKKPRGKLASTIGHGPASELHHEAFADNDTGPLGFHFAAEG